MHTYSTAGDSYYHLRVLASMTVWLQPNADNWEGSGAKEVWEKYYGNRKAVNIGIGGDRTQHVLYRLQNGNLEGIKPKAAVDDRHE